MRVLQITKIYKPDSYGGTEESIDKLTQELARRNVQSEIATVSYHKNTREMAGIKVHCFKNSITLASCPISYDFLKNFPKLSNAFDLLHFHCPWPFADFSYLLRKINKPYIITYNSDIIKQKVLKYFYFPLMNVFLSRAHKIITSSENFLSSSHILSAYRDKTTVIPFGLEPPPLQSALMDRINHWRLTVGENFFLFVGVFRHYKGLTFLLQAVKNTSIPVLLLGAGPLESQLRAQKTALRLEQVKFLGQLSDVDKFALIYLSRAVVLPSHLPAESFGFALLEGLACGKPLISTELGTGTSVVNKQGVTGFVVPPGEPQALRQAMETLLNNEQLAKEMGDAARKHFTKYFTVDKMVDAYLKVYERVLAAGF